jgi:hypothetical protein
LVPCDLDPKDERSPAGFQNECLIAANIALVEQKLDKGVCDAVEFGLGQWSLVIDRDNRITRSFSDDR